VQWEYRTVTHQSERSPQLGVQAIDEARVRELNRLGSEGWELVTVVPVTHEDLMWAVTYVFKRPSDELHGSRVKRTG
jgi:Domain of unknown function (DUF4177)